MSFITIIIPFVLWMFQAYCGEVQMCPCKNGGYCTSYNPSPLCICPRNYIGELCQLSAIQIGDQPLTVQLLTNFTYFYFQPHEINYYKLVFNICMEANPSNSYTIFFIQTQKNDGTLRIVPSLFETAKLVLGSSACTTFGTHYISAKRREDQKFRRIIVGMKVMQEQEAIKYLNVYLGQNKLSMNSVIVPHLSLHTTQVRRQQIILSMSYEVYIHSALQYSTFMLLFASSVLFLMLTVFLLYLRSKYAMNSTNLDEVQLDNFRLEWQRRNRFNREYITYRYRTRNIRRLNMFMPITKYRLGESKLVSKSLTTEEEQLYDKRQMQTCSICLMDFEQDDHVRTTPCFHRYHRDCIDSWCQNKMNCPYCRTQLNFDEGFSQAYCQFIRNELRR